jgi:hypothetical protein
MPTHAGERPGLGAAAKLVADHARTIVKLELELAATELKKKVVALGLGIGLLVGAALFGFFALAFALAAAAAGIATAVSTWLALLIVAGGLFLLVGVLGVVGLGAVRKGTPPVPQQALEEARLTTEALKNGGH